MVCNFQKEEFLGFTLLIPSFIVLSQNLSFIYFFFVKLVFLCDLIYKEFLHMFHVPLRRKSRLYVRVQLSHKFIYLSCCQCLSHCLLSDCTKSKMSYSPIIGGFLSLIPFTFCSFCYIRILSVTYCIGILCLHCGLQRRTSKCLALSTLSNAGI